MAIPSFGPSQRLELSCRYFENNSLGGKCDRFRLYERVDPRVNVAEEGQVVLLSNNLRSGSNYLKTEVIPDAAGYQIDCDVFRDFNKEEQSARLVREMSAYAVGVNQVERGVRSPHSASGYGWDISVACNTGHPVTVRHTGSERIHRFDLIGVRFPNEADVEAQTDRWNANGSNRGVSVCKFATYPVRENWEVLKCNRFVSDMHALATDVRCGYREDPKNGPILHLQLPALLNVLKEVRLHEEAFEGIHLDVSDGIDCRALSSENLEEALQRLALAATKFAGALTPPMLFAQCVGFQCVQPHSKSWAECGDLLNCVFL